MTDNMSFEKVSQEYYDVLKELGNIGAGNATTALAQMLQCKVDMKVPQVRLLNFNEVGEVMGGEEQIVAGIYLAVEGDITGSMMFILEQEAAKSLVEKLMGMPLQDGLDEMGISALKEIGNIITGAYLNSLSQLTNLKMVPSVPDLSIDMLNAILQTMVMEELQQCCERLKPPYDEIANRFFYKEQSVAQIATDVHSFYRNDTR